MTALILQARLNSSRLPQKSLLPLGGRPLILRVMQALELVHGEVKILACPEDSVSAFAPLADEAGFTLVSGPLDDVLKRYCIAIRASGADRLIRATGDNPFVFIDAAQTIHAEALAIGADYAGYSGLPHGSGVESVSCAALLRCETLAQDSMEREHVCPYLYHHPELFKLHRPLAPKCWQGSNVRITVDTKEDYERAKILYNDLLSLPLSLRIKGENIIAAWRKCFIPDEK